MEWINFGDYRSWENVHGCVKHKRNQNLAHMHVTIWENIQELGATLKKWKSCTQVKSWENIQKLG